MRTVRFTLLSIFLMLSWSYGFSQENKNPGGCSDGVDSDGDGFIDCFDSDCSADPSCSSFYLGNNVVCNAKPVGFPKFSMQLAWQSQNQTTNHLNRVSVGDLDRDGFPEVVATEIEGKYIYILDGRTGATKKSLKVGYTLDREVVIGNIDNSNCAWVFTSGGNYIYAYDCNLNQKWKSTLLSSAPWQFGLADFDNDGKIEIYSRDEIIDAHTGIRMVKGTDAANIVGEPLAVDMIGDSKLELVAGLRIYSVNDLKRASLPSQDKGSLTLTASVSSFYIRQGQSSTSVADYNLDGFLDVIASGSDGGQDANTTVFLWDYHNDPTGAAVKKYIDKNSASVFIAGCTNASCTCYKNGWQNGTGRINIADIDGDGNLNATYVSGKYLYALDQNWNLKWRVVVNEETSGYTGCTVYDFNGDGAAEVVYRDEQFLYIINGNDGSVNTQQQCIARTQVEYPIVADVNGDGATELCVTCGFNDALAWANFCDITYSKNSCVRVFQSASIPWVPSRKLWNQHAYFNVNVNDDLTIPKYMQKPWLVWSTNSCYPGATTRPLNTFLNQTPLLNSQGCPVYAAPDLQHYTPYFSIQQPTCPSTDFKVTIGIVNNGDATLNAQVPVTFYSGDPSKTGATKLNTVYLTVSNLSKGTFQKFTDITVTGTGGNFTLYINLNDAGTSMPSPVILPNTPIVECNYANAYAVSVKPKSVPVVVQVTNNVKCLGAPVADNGTASASVTINGSPNTADFNFYWYNGAVSGAPVYTGSTYTGLPAGSYTVYAVHKTAGCSSDTAVATINRVDKVPMNASIQLDSANSSCVSPNGVMHAVVNGGDPISNYTFKWYEGNDIFTSPEIGVGDVASNLKGNQIYTVLVTDNSSGCQAVASQAVSDNTSKPSLNANPTNANCLPVNSGSATADVGGVVIGYTFKWYNGSATKPSADFTGPVYSSLVPGSYTVTATDAAGCVSNPSTVQVTLPPTFTVNANRLTKQTSCLPASPNGSASADVGGVTAGYTFSWFSGQNTLPANAIAGPNGLAAGDYTVQATNNLTQCSATDTVTILSNLVYPIVSTTAQPNSICSNTLGTGQYTGSVTATATYNGNPVGSFSNYQIVWHNGALATDPVITGASSPSITQLNGGNYTVVITETTSGCASAPSTGIVTNTPQLPTITTSQTPSTNCVAGKENGVAQVSSVVSSSTSFSYQWYTGSNTSSIITGAINATLQNLQGGPTSDYTVLVTDLVSGCQNTATVLVTDGKVVPLISPNTTPNSVCDPLLTNPTVQFNGTITANISNQVGLLSDYSFSSLGTGVQNNNLYSQLNTGTYSLTVTQISTGCTSAATNAIIGNTKILPSITTTFSASTNCDPLLANGKAIVSDVDGAGTGSPYKFEWYDGNTVSGAVKATTAIYPNVQGGSGEDYTVQVTNQSSGCQNTKTVLVGDSKVLPTLTFVEKDNTVCNPSLTNPSLQFNGKITTTISNQGANPLTDYTFTYAGGGAQTPTGGLQGSPTANVWDQLNGGPTAYTVQVKQISTGCVSVLGSVPVVNTQVLPSITTTFSASTNCDPLLANGKAIVSDVDGAGTGSPYKFEWYDGNTVSGAVKATTAIYPNVQGGSGEDYTVQVTNQSSGCQNTKTVLVGDSKVLPTLTFVEKDNTVCNPSLTNPSLQFNGKITTTISNQGANPLTDYTFTYAGGGAQTPTGGLQGSPTANVWDQLNGGPTAYTVQVKQISTGCVSVLGSVPVVNTQVLPSITTTFSASTNCDPLLANGKAIVSDVDGAGTGSPYKFEWYDGNAVSGAVKATAATYPNVKGGSGQYYTVQVTNQSSGCQNNQTVQVGDNSAAPVITLSKTDNANCSVGKSGTASLATLTDSNNGGAVSSPFAGYSFSWSTSASTSSISNLDSGVYTLTVKNNALGCTSAPTSISVKNNIFTPPINIAATPQTSCTGTPNGILAATIDESSIGGGASVTAGYTFAWVNNGNPFTSPGTSAGSTSQITGLNGNINYTITVTKASSGCANSKSVLLQENISVPTVNLVASDQVKCAPTDGKIVATVSPAPAQKYLFFWMLEQPNTVTTDSSTVISTVKASPSAPNRKFLAANGATTDTDPNLHFGSYTLVVVDNYTGCASQPTTATINDKTNSAITITDNTLASTCGVSNGKLDVSAVRNDGLPTTFKIDIHAGGPTNTVTPINFYTNPPTFDNTLTPGPFLNLTAPVTQGSLSSQTYTIVATDGFGCKNYETHFLPFANPHSIVDAETNSSSCPYTSGNGLVSVDLTVAPAPAAATTKDQYTINAYTGGNVVAANKIFAHPAAAGISPPIATPSNLTPGFYTIEVIGAAINGSCPVTKVVEIKAIALSPVLSLASTITNNNGCGAGNFNGVINVNVVQDPNDTNPGPVTYTIKKNGGAFQAGVMAGNYPANNLAPGFYTFDVTASTGCTTSRTYQIDDQPTIAQLATADVATTDAQYCTASLEQSAKVVISNVKIQSGTNENIADYRFDWYTNSTLTTNVFSSNGNTLSPAGGDEFINNVPPGFGTVPAGTVTVGSYWIVLTKVADASATGGIGCLSSPYKVDIKNNTVKPTVTLTPSSNTACDTNYEGQIVVQASDSGGPGMGSTYNYSWNAGNPTAIASGNYNGNNNAFTGLKDSGASAPYTSYQVTVLNNATGCFTQASTNVLQSLTPVVVANASHVDQFKCNPDGSITVGANDILVNGSVDSNHNNFVFNWYANSPSSATIASGMAVDVLDIVNYPTIAAGDYYLTVARSPGVAPGSGCKSAPLKVTLSNKSINPTVTMSSLPNTACDTNYEGSITVSASDASGPGMGSMYNYAWNASDPTFIANNNYNGNNNLFSNLADGGTSDTPYILTVTNIATGCSTQAQTKVLQSLTPVVVTSASHTDQFICNPDGSITVGNNQILVNGTPDNTFTDFVFNWYANSPSTPAVVSGVASNVLNIGNYPTIGAGDYYLTVAKSASVAPGSGCTSAPQKITILNKSVNPTVVMTALPNTACDASYEGSITVNASDPNGTPGFGSMYSYVWNASNPTFIANNNFNGVNNTFTNLADGGTSNTPYILTVTNNATNCSTQSQTNILLSATPVVVASASHADQFLCKADGSITVGPNDILVNGAVDSNHNLFVFDWYMNSPSSASILSGTNLDQLNAGNYATIGAGDYYVTATRANGVPVGSGCKSAPLKVTILNKSVNPTVKMTSTPNTACDTNYEGSITVNASDASGPGAVVGATFNYVWSAGNPTFIANNTFNGNNNLFTGLKDGGASPPYNPYVLTATNNITGCSSQAQVVLLQGTVPISLVASVIDQAVCKPDGTITVGNISVNNSVDGNHNNFNFKWYQNDPTTAIIASGVGVDVLSTANFPAIAKGTYYVTVTRLAGVQPGSGCTSSPLRKDINDVHVNPTIAAASINPDVYCIGGPGSGNIKINESSPLNFTYTWYTGDNTSGTIVLTVGGTNGEVAQNLQDGDYTVLVKDNSSNCTSQQSYTVPNQPTVVSISGVSVGDVMNCNIATGGPMSNGSATITSVQENNVSQPLGSYNFVWKDASSTQLQNSGATTLSGLAPGDYTVVATNTTSNCNSDMGFTVNDKTIGSTSITLIDFGQPERCVNPKTGYLTVQGGAAGDSYSYDWYNGVQPPSGAPVFSSPASTSPSTLTNIAIIAGQNFTVKAIKTSNSCWAIDTYPVPLITNAIVLTASGNPLTTCPPKASNGEAYATTVNDNKFDYNYYWGIGTTVNTATPDYTGNDVPNLSSGNYTVQAVDKLDAGCVSPAITVTIENNQVHPVVTTIIVHDLTNCDVTKPNGDLSANVNGDIVHYTFDWYVGSTATGTPFFNGPEVNDLTNIAYTVLATETTTGCTGTATVTVPTTPEVVPTPTITVLANQTSCFKDSQGNPKYNGKLGVTVGGVTKDYTFDWNDGDTPPPPITFTGEFYDSLNVGDYTVRATSNITGCSSNATGTIINQQKFPTISFLIQDASCSVNNGFITLLVSNGLALDTVIWKDKSTGQVLGTGPNLADAYAGTYTVTVVTTQGCETDQDVTVPANINPFNGISRNGDAKNERFWIDCIDNFKKNHVEIFNRVGTKVYEADGYNNTDTYFDGRSNRGLSILGTQLPPGTYFYVISKGDGSKAVAGYLELVD
ncbi:MAG: gliding motility-associated C-terminal domain-containing protein [Cyclobacteriaceae bacterium]